MAGVCHSERTENLVRASFDPLAGLHLRAVCGWSSSLCNLKPQPNKHRLLLETQGLPVKHNNVVSNFTLQKKSLIKMKTRTFFCSEDLKHQVNV